MINYYSQGFMDTCSRYGVDCVKLAQYVGQTLPPPGQLAAITTPPKSYGVPGTVGDPKDETGGVVPNADPARMGRGGKVPGPATARDGGVVATTPSPKPHDKLKILQPTSNTDEEVPQNLTQTVASYSGTT